MDFITLNCPNCNGQVERQKGKTFKCPNCDTELLLKGNDVYYVDQTINNYYGTTPATKTTDSNRNKKSLILLPIIIICAFFAYYWLQDSSVEYKNQSHFSIRSLPESEVLISFLQDILDKGEAVPTEEEIATIRYLSVHYVDDQWQFSYSLDDPYTNKQATITDYMVTDKLLNKQRIEQKDFEAFSGLTVLRFNNVYEISQSLDVSFRHLQQLKSYSGAFNESFYRSADYFGDKANIVELTTQIRSNEELALLLQFPQLKTLHITYVTETVTDFHLLNQLPLQSVAVSGVNDLKWLSTLPHLQSLTVDYSDATDFSALYALSQLTELKFIQVKNIKTLDFIPNMPNLQSLELQSVDITSLDRIRDKSSLTKLRLKSLNKLESLEAINSLTSLTELEVTGYYGNVSSIDLPNLKVATVMESLVPRLTAPAMKDLTIYTRGSTSELEGETLVKYPKLEQLTLLERGEFIGISALNRLPHLQTLHLFETTFYEETNALFQLKHVTNLYCEQCTFQIGNEVDISNDVLEHVTLNRSSFVMNYSDSVYDMDKVMPYFSQLTGLRSFTMQDGSIQSLQFMKDWQHVEVLHLENNAISNVEPLVNLPALKKVYILGNQVQNQSVLDDNILVY